MNGEQKRRLIRVLRWTEPALDALLLAAIALLLASFAPIEIFNALPATGGDTGSHFWPLRTLLDYSLPNLTVRVWNPGNLGGEPHLVGYFPVPYFVMAILSLFMPAGRAFNIGIALSMAMLPFAAYACTRLMALRFPIPILSAAVSLFFLLNESFSMWGGNGLSTLAGQFAHAYALSLMLLGTGFLAREVREAQPPVWSAIIFAAVTACHSYAFFGLPFIYLAVLCCSPSPSFAARFAICAVSGCFALLLSAWFLVPMLANAPWTTPFSIVWNSGKLWAEACPPVLYPVLGVAAAVPLCLSYRSGRRRWFPRLLFFFLIPCAGYAALFFVFPLIGAVDVRAFPQMQLFLCLLAGGLLGLLLQRIGRIPALVLTIPLVLAALWWANLHVVQLPTWMSWNFSGWQTKALYPELTQLSDRIRGSFSDPRVVYEHNVVSQGAGTERVFEMLPYFTGRATLESVYLQASILSPAAFEIQARVSKTPSCPFWQYGCPHFDLPAAAPLLELMGVGTLILITPELLEQARQLPSLLPDGVYGPWHVFQIADQPALAEVFERKPLLTSDPHWQDKFFVRRTSRDTGEIPRRAVNSADWKELFYQWFARYDGLEPMMVINRGPGAVADNLLNNAEAWSGARECRPQVEVKLNQLILRTPCPGRAHYLKFAFHSSWRTDSGDPLFMTSPGFLALVPSHAKVVLTFGQSPLWKAAGAVSVGSLILLVVLAIFWKKRRSL